MRVAMKTAFLTSLGGWLMMGTTPTRAQTTWYVDAQGADTGGCTSWDDACPQLQTALDLAVFGDQIWVAGGTYRPISGPSPRERTFRMVSGVSMYGGFDGTESSLDERAGLFDQTVLNGRVGSINVYHVVTAVRLRTTVLDGFTITGGRARGPCCDHDRGGGIFIGDRFSLPTILKIHNCAIIDNEAYTAAGGVWMKRSDVTMSNCRIENNEVSPGNSGAAIQDVFESSLTLINTVFRNNTLSPENTGGAAIFVGGNIVDASASMVSALNCVFDGHRASAGGAILNNGFAWLTNTLFIDNGAEGDGYGEYTGSGGAIANFGELTVTNCSFFDNSAVRAGAGLFHGFQTANTNLDSMTVVANTIFWGNRAPIDLESAQVYSEDEDLEIDYSCVEGLSGMLGGHGNIGDDPIFQDPASENLHLSPESPCIDAGDNFAFPEEISTDLDGRPRFQNDLDTHNTGRPGGIHLTVDMGAYEFSGASCADDDGDGFVTLCHLTNGRKAKPQTRAVPADAVPAHLSHGDRCGACQSLDVAGGHSSPGRTSSPVAKRRVGADRNAQHRLEGVRLPHQRGSNPLRAIDADADGVLDVYVR